MSEGRAMSGTRIKICGLYRECDIFYVNETRPDYAGFIFYPPSHRYVTEEQMKGFRKLLASEIPAVGVFVGEPAERIARYLKEGLIQIAQLHGQETDQDIETLRALAPGHEIWKAFRIQSEEDLEQAVKSGADRILLDNGYGTGKSFDWKLMEGKEIPRPFLLAGGLDPENAAEAIDRFRPWGVDVSSGVETDKRKDLDKIRRMIRNVRRI